LQRSILTPSALGLSLFLAGFLAGCSSGAVIDQMPSSVGLPAGTPERPTTPYVYPAVHDMPPPRATPTLSEEQQVEAEKELTTVRDRQEAGDQLAKKTAPPAKKKPAAADTNQAAAPEGGAKTNP
jgi:hypothetical protein